MTEWVAGVKTGKTILGGRGKGSGKDQLNYPKGVAVDQFGNIYVTD